jgi:aspartyl-tRNA(Asn)/glutamyl-tRNA(Gln) amidotransferase subunit B
VTAARRAGRDGDAASASSGAHLEEDAAKTVHVGGGTGARSAPTARSIDFNRGGTPLVEIVTQPDIRSADDSERFLQLLRQTIVELGISDARWRGPLRCDANVSVRPCGSDELRTRWELKNMNSFTSSAAGSTQRRASRSSYESGGEVVQQTYDYEPDTDTLTPHRSKEEAEDYRYFPSPTSSRSSRRASSSSGSGRSSPSFRVPASAGSRTQSGSTSRRTSSRPGVAGLYERIVGAGVEPPEAAKVINEPVRSDGRRPRSRDRRGARESLVAGRDGIPRQAFTEALAASAEPGFSAERYLRRGDGRRRGELEPLVDAVIAESPSQVAALPGRQGRAARLLRRTVMKRTNGRADPRRVNELLREKLSA